MVLRSSPHSQKHKQYIEKNVSVFLMLLERKEEGEQGHPPFPAVPWIQLFIYFLINSLLRKPLGINASQVVKIYAAALKLQISNPTESVIQNYHMFLITQQF